jgi:hypothetical protein
MVQGLVENKYLSIICRQSHKSFFEKSDLFFVCLLRPLSYDITKQDSEIEACQVLGTKIPTLNCYFVSDYFNKKNPPLKGLTSVLLATFDQMLCRHSTSQLQWMPVEEFAAQPFVQKHELVKYILEVSLAKVDKEYAGFSPISIKSAFSDKLSLFYLNRRDLDRASGSSKQ